MRVTHQLAGHATRGDAERVRQRSCRYHRRMASTPANLASLHQHEEAIRGNSLSAIVTDSALSEHLQAVHDALDLLTVLLHVPTTPGSDRHTMQLFVIRLFNA